MSPQSPLAIDYSKKGDEYRAKQEQLKKEKPIDPAFFVPKLSRNMGPAVARMLEAQKQQQQAN